MKPIVAEVKNVALTLKNINPNKTFACKDCEDSYCSLKSKLSLTSSKNSLTMTEAIFNVRNASSTPWSTELKYWEMVDTDGFTFAAEKLCDNLRPPRFPDIDYYWKVTPGTQTNFILVFPELEKNQKVASIIYHMDDEITKFEINPMSNDALNLLQIQEEEATAKAIENNYDLNHTRRMLDHLEMTVNSRLNNILIPKEAVKLENSIQNSSFQIQQKMTEMSEKTRQSFEARYQDVLSLYNSQIEIVKSKENERKKLDQKVEKLYELSPREFEEYTADLLTALNYEKVTLTPAVNDKGIDIMAEYRGLRIAVQCKKYKGLVGSPNIQTFLGAMRHAEAHRGLFITTGQFSIEAEKIASDHPIELIDSLALGNLIQKALGNHE